MGPKQKPTQESVDPETEKQFREEQIARELFQMDQDTATQTYKKNCRH